MRWILITDSQWFDRLRHGVKGAVWQFFTAASRKGAVASAVIDNDLPRLAELIRNGADLDQPLPEPAWQHWTPLMHATMRHHFDAMAMLLAAGADVDAQTAGGDTAIMFTSQGRDEDLAALEILCRYRPALDKRDARGRNILDEARDRERWGGKPAMRELLQRHYPGLVI